MQLGNECVKCSENEDREDHVTEKCEEQGKSLSQKGLTEAVNCIMRCAEDGGTFVDEGETKATVRTCGSKMNVNNEYVWNMKTKK